jgi:hypothetical protein
MLNRVVYIYGLRTINSDEYRYIGKTFRIDKRLNEHLKEKKRKKSYHKYNWINQCIENKIEILLDIIDITDEQNWENREIYYIKYYKEIGNRLTNLLDGGKGPQIKYNISYDDAKKISISMNIKTTNQWRKMCKSNMIPDNIPKRPDLYYKNNGWTSWSEWLGYEIIKNSDKNFLKYEDAKEYVIRLNLKSNNEWREFCKNKKNDEIPSCPDLYYKDNGWVSWSEWLGYDKIKLRKKPEYLSYDDAKEYLKNIKIKTSREWIIFSKSSRPVNIPSNPWKYYKEWSGYKDFLSNLD